MPGVLDLKDFAGTWRLDRVIYDKRSGAEGRLTGTATFTQDGEDMIYEENGKLSYANQPEMAAHRRYIWRQNGNEIAVLFEDGAPFHSIDRKQSMPTDEHHCDPDMYHVSYRFEGWPNWQATWRVVGPKKDYRLVSNFSRAMKSA